MNFSPLRFLFGSFNTVSRLPILLGLLIGVIAGSQLLSVANPEWRKFFTYITLLPLILLPVAVCGARFGLKSRSACRLVQVSAHVFAVYLIRPWGNWLRVGCKYL